MKPRTLAALSLLALCLAGVALADRTAVILTAPSTVVRLEFYPPGDGGVMPASVCGRTRFGDGGITPVTCHDVPNGGLPAGNAINTAVQSLANGQAKTFWQGQEGL